MNDYSLQSDVELIRNIDFYLKRAGHLNDKYKVIEILERCRICVCLSDIKVLENLLGFNIREYIFNRSSYYLGIDNCCLKNFSDINKYIRKSQPLPKNLYRKSKYPKIDFDIIRLAILNSL